MTQADIDAFFRNLDSVDEEALNSRLHEAALETRAVSARAEGAIPYCDEYCRFRSIIVKIPGILEKIPFPGAKKLAALVHLLITIADAVCACA